MLIRVSDKSYAAIFYADAYAMARYDMPPGHAAYAIACRYAQRAMLRHTFYFLRAVLSDFMILHDATQDGFTPLLILAPPCCRHDGQLYATLQRCRATYHAAAMPIFMMLFSCRLRRHAADCRLFMPC